MNLLEEKYHDTFNHIIQMIQDHFHDMADRFIEDYNLDTDDDIIYHIALYTDWHIKNYRKTLELQHDRDIKMLFADKPQCFVKNFERLMIDVRILNEEIQEYANMAMSLDIIREQTL